jgi:FimV-like protein
MNHSLTTVALFVSLVFPASAATTYGPTRDQETLWSIATRLKPTSDLSVQQTALALYRKNPEAFESNNINALKNNVVLRIPTLAEIRANSYTQALRTTQSHNQIWQTYSNALSKTTSTVVSPRTVNKVLVQRPVRVIEKPVVVASTSRKQQESEIRQLKQQVTVLSQELANAKNQTRELRRQLAKNKAQQNNNTVTEEPSNKVAQATNPAPISTQPTQQEIDIAKQVQKLTAQVADLESILAEKNSHINNLKASLKNASETIKRQHTENQQLVTQLKTGVDANSNTASANSTPTASAPTLELAEVQNPPSTSPASNNAAENIDGNTPLVIAPSTGNAGTEISKTSTDNAATSSGNNTTTTSANSPAVATSTASNSSIAPTANPSTTSSPLPTNAVSTSVSDSNKPTTEASTLKESKPDNADNQSANLVTDTKTLPASLPTTNSIPAPAVAQPTQGVWAEEKGADSATDSTVKPSNGSMQPTNDVRNTTAQPLTNDLKSATVANDLNLPAKVETSNPLFGNNGTLPPPSWISYVIGVGALGFIGLLWWRSRRNKKQKELLPQPEQERRRQNIRQDPVIPFESIQRKSKGE